MPRPKGLPRTGGRKKGTPNKKTLEVQQLIEQSGLDPLEFLIAVTQGDLHCNVCRGKKKTKYKLDNGQLGERVCESCYGSGYEVLSPEVRVKAASELAQYHRPKRKAIEVSGNLGMGAAETLRAKRQERQNGNPTP